MAQLYYFSRERGKPISLIGERADDDTETRVLEVSKPKIAKGAKKAKKPFKKDAKTKKPQSKGSKKGMRKPRKPRKYAKKAPVDTVEKLEAKKVMRKPREFGKKVAVDTAKELSDIILRKKGLLSKQKVSSISSESLKQSLDANRAPLISEAILRKRLETKQAENVRDRTGETARADELKATLLQNTLRDLFDGGGIPYVILTQFAKSLGISPNGGRAVIIPKIVSNYKTKAALLKALEAFAVSKDYMYSLDPNGYPVIRMRPGGAAAAAPIVVPVAPPAAVVPLPAAVPAAAPRRARRRAAAAPAAALAAAPAAAPAAALPVDAATSAANAQILYPNLAGWTRAGRQRQLQRAPLKILQNRAKTLNIPITQDAVSDTGQYSSAGGFWGLLGYAKQEDVPKEELIQEIVNAEYQLIQNAAASAAASAPLTNIRPSRFAATAAVVGGLGTEAARLRAFFNTRRGDGAPGDAEDEYFDAQLFAELGANEPELYDDAQPTAVPIAELIEPAATVELARVGEVGIVRRPQTRTIETNTNPETREIGTDADPFGQYQAGERAIAKQPKIYYGGFYTKTQGAEIKKKLQAIPKERLPGGRKTRFIAAMTYLLNNDPGNQIIADFYDGADPGGLYNRAIAAYDNPPALQAAADDALLPGLAEVEQAPPQAQPDIRVDVRTDAENTLLASVDADLDNALRDAPGESTDDRVARIDIIEHVIKLKEDIVNRRNTERVQDYIANYRYEKPDWTRGGVVGGSLMGGGFLKDLVNKAVDYVKSNPKDALAAAKKVAGFVNDHKSKAAELYNKYVKGKSPSGGILDGMSPRAAKDHLRKILTMRHLLKTGGRL